MTKAFEYLVTRSHSLREFRGHAPEVQISTMRRRFGTASSGERAMIRAALNLIPAAWIEGLSGDDEVPSLSPFRLSDVGVLHVENTRALFEAIAIHAGHIEVVDR